MPDVVVGSIGDFEKNSVVQVMIMEEPIAIYRLESGEFYATHDVCTHGQAYLSDGWLTDDCAIECPLHGGCFDLRTGEGLGPPIEEKIRTFPIRVEGDDVIVTFDSAGKQ